MTLFKQKYRIESTRLKGWNYASAGYYFVTICTHQRQCVLGQVVDGNVILSPIGEIVAEEWEKTAVIRANVESDEWIIMPNHLHGIIVITHEIVGQKGDNPNWKPNSLGSIIGQIKSKCTKRIRQAGYDDFRWQSRFYDRIIRDEIALQKARRYIMNNPAKWEHDREKPPNIFM